MISQLIISTLLAAGLSADAISFNRDVRPILSDNCFQCHGFDPAQRKAELRLDLRENAVGEKGVILPGDAENSELIKRITSDDPNFHMPPPDSKLSLKPEQIETIKSWIDAGAEYQPHWAFIPPQETVSPEVKGPEGWDKNPIDAFILQRLQDEGLDPSPEAPRENLLRRASFDLTGLPPTLEQVDQFLNDKEAGAYERAIDRLLAMPQFGERMAMVWLDMARYADTFGYQNDYENYVWPWRDWVIRAFSQNLPYDDFITWQIAGDLLPNATQDQKLATAFNRLHRQTNEGGSVLEEWRLEYVADRVSTFSTAFLGLTMQCARCHDHKFDPITQREFYAMGAFFSNIDESGMYSYYTEAVPSPTLLLYEDGERTQHAELKETVRELEKVLAIVPKEGEERFGKWLAANPEPVSAPEPAVHVAFDEIEDGSIPVAGSNIEDVNAKLVLEPGLVEGHTGKAVEFSGDNGVVVEGAGRFDRYDPFTLALWTKLPAGLDRGVIAHKTRAAEDAANRGYELVYENGKLYFMLAHFWPGNSVRIDTVEEVPADEWLHVAITYDGSSKAAGAKLYLNGEQQDVTVVRDNLFKTLLYEQRQSPTSRFPNPDEVKVPLALAHRDRDSGLEGGVIDELKVYNHALTPLEVRALHSEAPVSPSTDAEAAKVHYFQRVDSEYQKALQPLRQARDEEATFVQAIPEIMAMREMDEPRPDYILARGEYDKPGDFVAPDTPEAVMPYPESYPENRLGLARWATHPDNPLTARVAVNLFWQTIFGKGIVESQEDFGTQGKMPSHPQLLDYLAVWFQENEWDVKALVKLLVTSAT